MSNRREFLLTMSLALLGLRLSKASSSPARGACWDCGQVPTDRTEARATEVGLQCWDCFNRDTAEMAERWRLPWTTRLQPGAQLPTEADFQRAYEVP
ncbi:hypothetical protein LCGC14_1350210 [marine sediment metagenome]|uniref:Uncharacterized protein n=1 Tax=marine sediment metagenome TaxID=412755 RepID=A0A0F9KX73_9ZZZZ